MGECRSDAFLESILDWQEEGLVEVEDVVVVVRTAGGDIKIKQTKSLAGMYALRGSGIGIGLLAGMLLGGSIGGLIGGATIGAISGKMKDIGIEDKLSKDISVGLVRNTSALFLLGKSSDPEKLLD